MGVKVNCCTSRADPRPWYHQRYWLMVRLLLYLIKQCIWDILFIICTKDRENITLAAKNNFWKQFNMFIANFGQLHSFITIKNFSQFCCSFYGSPLSSLWYLNGVAVQALCVGWRKSSRSLWRVHPRTQCDVIMALSDQIPLMATLQKRSIKMLIKFK